MNGSESRANCDRKISEEIQEDDPFENNGEYVKEEASVKARSTSVPDYSTLVRNERKKRRFSAIATDSSSQTNYSQCFSRPLHSISDLNVSNNRMKSYNNNNHQQLENRNGNLLLQLVLPQRNDFNANSNDLYNNNFKKRPATTTNTTRTNSLTNSLRRERRNSRTSQNGIEMTPTSGSFNFPNNVRENSFQGTQSNFDCYASSDEEKSKMFRECLTKILSCVYALFIVTMGLVIYITDVTLHYSAIAEVYNLYLVTIASIYLAYAMIDLRVYVHKEKKYHNLNEKQQNMRDVQYYGHLNGNLHVSIPIASIINLHKPPHYYCLNKGRHCGNFYLKIGAAVFCLGHLVHSGLILGYQLVFLSTDPDAFFDCTSIISTILNVLYPLYSFVLLYFIFKYSNLIINRNTSLSRFGLMHTISSSLCFWMWTIIRETIDSLTFYAATIEIENDDGSDEQYDSYPQQSLLLLGSRNNNNNGSNRYVWMDDCNIDKGLRLIYENYSPYLYPFTVEYNILLVGVLYVIWQNVGKCNDRDGVESNCNGCGKKSDNTSNVVLHADFHSANKGLFCGIILVVISIVSIILFLIIISDEDHLEQGVMVNVITEIIFLISMATACLLAYRQITRLDVNQHSIPLLDDLLLFVCIPAFFIDTLFGIIPAVQKTDGFSISFIVLQLIQVLIQTPFIIDGLRRCSNSKKLREVKPGRELVTFLIVCNVALWITQTFEIKSHGLKDFRYDFYGKILWTIVGHATMPLMMFYRFHSSVCLVDIWKLAYEPVTTLH